MTDTMSDFNIHLQSDASFSQLEKTKRWCLRRNFGQYRMKTATASTKIFVSQCEKAAKSIALDVLSESNIEESLKDRF